MSSAPAVWITEAEVVDLLDLPEAIEALARGLAMEAGGAAHPMQKTHVAWGDGHTLHALGACFEGAGFAGTKTWAHTPGGATPLLVLWDAGSGALRAVIEAFALGQLRTASMSGAATRALARADAEVLAIAGTGKQALAQVAAIAAVRPIREVRAWSPTPAHRAAFAERVAAEGFAFSVREAPTIEAAVADASVVTLATRARAPFLEARMLAPGTHVNAIGAITPERAEFSLDLFARAAVVATDSLAAARRLSRELRDQYGPRTEAWDEVWPIASLVAGGWRRPEDADLTIFKAMGTGVADLALGAEILARAESRGMGRAIAQPARARPRLRG